MFFSVVAVCVGNTKFNDIILLYYILYCIYYIINYNIFGKGQDQALNQMAKKSSFQVIFNQIFATELITK